ncbi:MAG: ABC transporter permease [Actinomycetota bacterium]|nr:ABC transporter permease [Actinomycetota bacterium]
MTATTTATPPATSGVPAGSVEVHPVTQRRVLRSEWIKLRTLRSTVIVLAVTIIGMVGIGLLIAAVTNHNFASMAADERAHFNAIDRVLGGVNIAQLTVGVLGVLIISGEYSTGMIRATFGAVPTRLPVLWAKLVVFASVVFAVCIVASFAAFLGGEALLGTHGVSLSTPGALRAVVGVALYLTVAGLLGVAFGFIVRNTAGGIAALFGLLLVLPGLSNLLPTSWQNSVVPYFPSNAGQALYSQHSDHAMMHPWAGFALFVGYLAIAVFFAALSLRRRDA